MGCCAGVRLCAPAAERPRRASARDAPGPLSFEGQEGLVVSKGSRAGGAEFPCSEEEALCGVGTVCNCTELCVCQLFPARVAFDLQRRSSPGDVVH